MKKPIITVILVLMLPLLLHTTEKGMDAASVGPRTETVNLSDYQNVFYVSVGTGSDESGTGTREKPWKTLVFALIKIIDANRSGKTAVLVSEGTYSSGTVIMKEHVYLYGGFSPGTWIRNIFKYRTVLDGGRVRRVVAGASNARIDGFVITGGLARSHGGGILCEDTSPIISNNFIMDNFVLEPQDFNSGRIHQQGYHGGGIACLYNALPVIRNNVIANNKTSIGNGGGIAFYGWLRMPEAPEPVVQANRFEGGLQPLVENNVLMGNISGVNDIHRTRSSNGGGISCAFEARPVIRNNIIAGNQARGRGDAGGIYNEYYSDPLIIGNWILGNTSEDDAGGIYTMRMGQPVIEANFIAGNWAPGRGVGGIRMSKEGRARIIGNRIVRNLSGGGVDCVDSYMELENNVIMHNEGGPAVMLRSRFSYFMPSVVRNNILEDNEGRTVNLSDNHGQQPIVENNSFQDLAGSGKNSAGSPESMDDTIRGKIQSSLFDPVSFSTIFTIQKSIGKTGDMQGRVVLIGKQWSVIKAAEGRNMTVWGDLSTVPGSEFEVISQYRMMK